MHAIWSETSNACEGKSIIFSVDKCPELSFLCSSSSFLCLFSPFIYLFVCLFWLFNRAPVNPRIFSTFSSSSSRFKGESRTVPARARSQTRNLTFRRKLWLACGWAWLTVNNPSSCTLTGGKCLTVLHLNAGSALVKHFSEKCVFIFDGENGKKYVL